MDHTDYGPLFAVTSMQSLDEIGATTYREMQESSQPAPEITALAAQIVGDRTGLDAARAISNWVATHISYVAVYLSFDGGWVAHPPEWVVANGYGDCKDHVVLMQALLQARGIRSEMAIVQWGDRYQPLPVPIPWQFNHVIIHLPDGDIYSNPTDSYAGFGMLDRSLAGKTVVLVNPAGGHAVLPASRPADYRYDRTTSLTVAPNGTVYATASMAAGPGLAGELRRSVAEMSDPSDLVDRILASRSEGGTGTLDVTDPHDLDVPFTAKAKWASPHLLPMEGPDAYFAIPGGFDFGRIDDARILISPMGYRRTPLNVGVSDYNWQTDVTLPDGYTVIRMPANVDFSNAAGAYSGAYSRTVKGLSVTRHLRIDQDVFTPHDYHGFETLIVHGLDDLHGIVGIAKSAAPVAAAGPAAQP